jgi:hypothetical protein
MQTGFGVHKSGPARKLASIILTRSVNGLAAVRYGSLIFEGHSCIPNFNAYIALLLVLFKCFIFMGL